MNDYTNRVIELLSLSVDEISLISKTTFHEVELPQDYVILIRSGISRKNIYNGVFSFDVADLTRPDGVSYANVILKSIENRHHLIGRCFPLKGSSGVVPFLNDDNGANYFINYMDGKPEGIIVVNLEIDYYIHSSVSELLFNLITCNFKDLSWLNLP